MAVFKMGGVHASAGAKETQKGWVSVHQVAGGVQLRVPADHWPIMTVEEALSLAGQIMALAQNYPNK